MSVNATAAGFMAAAPPSLNGNSPWAQRYAKTLLKVFHDHAAQAPRTLQVHLGPSELGVECDRQVAGKLAGLPTTNHVSDPWPSIRGTALHAWAAEAFTADNAKYGYQRWTVETRVYPHPDHSGTGDLYDLDEYAMVDHKFLGESSLNKVRKKPPRKYVVQLLLYALGWINKGFPVTRIVLAAYPATKASMDDMYVWEHVIEPADWELIAYVWEQTDYRKQWAAWIVAQDNPQQALRTVPADTKEDREEECYWCPFYRPQAAHDAVFGCPGPDKTGATP